MAPCMSACPVRGSGRARKGRHQSSERGSTVGSHRPTEPPGREQGSDGNGVSSNPAGGGGARPPLEADAMAITVRPEYATRYSDPRVHQYVFTYDVTIRNVGGETAQLLWRHWLIHDPVAGDHEVEG
ncbi:MAG: ApaG domain, partial [Gammaproteobacteria bacterium]|nr:ApaG domain [Gammaproteobacteria bacterium]